MADLTGLTDCCVCERLGLDLSSAVGLVLGFQGWGGQGVRLIPARAEGGLNSRNAREEKEFPAYSLLSLQRIVCGGGVGGGKNWIDYLTLNA